MGTLLRFLLALLIALLGRFLPVLKGAKRIAPLVALPSYSLGYLRRFGASFSWFPLAIFGPCLFPSFCSLMYIEGYGP